MIEVCSLRLKEDYTENRSKQRRNKWMVSRERRSERRIAHCRSRSLSFNSQSFDSAVPGCRRVVRKIPRIVFIRVQGRRVHREDCFFLSLFFSHFVSVLTVLSSPHPRIGDDFFLAFETGSGARTMVFTIVRPGVPRENAPIVHDQMAVTARFLRTLRIISRELLSREVLLGQRRFYRETSISKNLLPLVCQWLRFS